MVAGLTSPRTHQNQSSIDGSWCVPQSGLWRVMRSFNSDLTSPIRDSLVLDCLTHSTRMLRVTHGGTKGTEREGGFLAGPEGRHSDCRWQQPPVEEDGIPFLLPFRGLSAPAKVMSPLRGWSCG
jgi:hypothetical protein